MRKTFLTMLTVVMIATPCLAGKPTVPTTPTSKVVTFFDNACGLVVGDVSETLDVAGYDTIVFHQLASTETFSVAIETTVDGINWMGKGNLNDKTYNFAIPENIQGSHYRMVIVNIQDGACLTIKAYLKQ